MEIENINSYKIINPLGNLIFYPATQELFLEYYDENEDEDYEVLLWRDGKYVLSDVSVPELDKYITIFLEYQEKNK